MLPVSIGERCIVGSMSVVMPQTSLDNDVVIAPMSMVPLGVSLPPDTIWEGSPVRPKDGELPTWDGEPIIGEGGDLVLLEESIIEMSAGRCDPASMFLVIPMRILAILLPFLLTWVAFWPMAVVTVLLWQVNSTLVAIALGFGFVAAQALYMAMATALKWAVLGRCIPGRYSAYSAYGLRFGFVKSCLAAPLAKSFCTLFADTRYIPFALRSLGARIESLNTMLRIPSITLAGADQIHIAESAKIGDSVSVLGAAYFGDALLIAPTSLSVG